MRQLFASAVQNRGGSFLFAIGAMVRVRVDAWRDPVTPASWGRGRVEVVDRWRDEEPGLRGEKYMLKAASGAVETFSAAELDRRYCKRKAGAE